MLILKRYENNEIYIVNRENNEIINTIKVVFIDPDGDFIDLNIDGRVLTLSSNILADGFALLFKGVFRVNGRLSVSIGVDTDHEIIRKEIYSKEGKPKLITKKGK